MSVSPVGILCAAIVFAVGGAWALATALAERPRRRGRSTGAREARLRNVVKRLDEPDANAGLGPRVAIPLGPVGITVPLVYLVPAAIAAIYTTYLAVALVLPAFLAWIVTAVLVRLAWSRVARLRDQRRQEFVGQLPEVARILSNAAAAGLSVRTAIERAAVELEDPASGELHRVAADLRVGDTLDKALTALERRMPARDVSVLIGTLRIQQEHGGRLVSTLQRMSDTLVERREVQREIRTLMSGPLVASRIAASFPVLGMLILTTIDPQVFDRVAETPWARLVVLGALATYAFAFWLIKRVTAIRQ